MQWSKRLAGDSIHARRTKQNRIWYKKSLKLPEISHLNQEIINFVWSMALSKAYN
jgi:hypothetical protein